MASSYQDDGGGEDIYRYPFVHLHPDKKTTCSHKYCCLWVVLPSLEFIESRWALTDLTGSWSSPEYWLHFMPTLLTKQRSMLYYIYGKRIFNMSCFYNVILGYKLLHDYHFTSKDYVQFICRHWYIYSSSTPSPIPWNGSGTTYSFINPSCTSSTPAQCVELKHELLLL